MTIGRVTSNADLYSHLRLDVYGHGRTDGRQSPPNSDSGNVTSRHSRQSSRLSLDVEDRPRSRRWVEEEDGTVVPFKQPTTELADQPSDYGGTAQEVPLTLEMDNAQRNPLLAQAALLYLKSGRAAGASPSGTVGTRLHAVV